MDNFAKSKILFIVDTPKWAHDIKTENIKKHLGSDFHIIKKFESDLEAGDIERADLVLVYYWRQFRGLKRFSKLFMRYGNKLVVGICSHHELEGKRRKVGLKTIRKYASAVFMNSMLLYDEFKAEFDVPIYYSPNGVDRDFFCPKLNKSRESTLIVGWAGSLTNQSSDHKGYRNYILPAAGAVSGVKLLTAAREDKWRSLQEMRDFYHSLDDFICASKSEGTPNPCLEAAACGVPLLSTRVGNMPELIKGGVNGYFIERDVADIKSRLEYMRDNRDLLLSFSKEILKSVTEWDWKIQSEKYRNMFNEVLSRNKV